MIDRVREAADVVDVISSYIPLKKSGANFTALCPFHTEKSPSFNVNPARQIWHCFGCGAGGNVITFVMKHENMGFPDALALLAARAGIPLPRDKEGEDNSYIYNINKEAADFYQRQLKTAPAFVGEYIKKRALTAETVDKFRIGYAPDAWDALYRHLVERKISPKEIDKAGLTKLSSAGNPIDRFRNRLIFPIVDEHNRVIAFGGRALADDEKGPKYLNSPETPVYNKSRVLYALNFAAAKARAANRVMIVEGYMDAIALHQAGFENVVASAGTAFTPQQCRALKRYTQNLVMIFDGDEAGRRAAARATEVAAELEIRPSVAMLPGGADPDDLIKQGGAAAFEDIVKNARPYMTYLIEQACRKFDVATPEGKADAIRSLLPELSRIADPIKRASYVELLAERTGIPATAIGGQLRNTAPRYAPQEGRTTAPREGQAVPTTHPKQSRPLSLPGGMEKWIVQIILDYPETITESLKTLKVEDFAEPGFRRMLEYILGRLAQGAISMDELIESCPDPNLKRNMLALWIDQFHTQEEQKDKIINDFIGGRDSKRLQKEKIADQLRRAQENLERLDQKE
ncbi:MAG: DNA primase [Nitrospinae bacterium]|nr:DNA primase [Nitrospinota bacterium]